MRRAAIALASVAGALLVARATRADCPPDAGDCQALLETGPTGSRVDFVIVGDGYTQAERDKFYADAQAVATDLQTASTYGSYAPVFNVWGLFVPSNESGADDPSTGTMVDTAFDSTYGLAGIDYLIGINTGKVFVEINGRFPERDQPIVLVNAPKYGGAGGTVAVVSTSPESLRIIEHEMGHSFAGLADEYETPYPGFPPGDPEPNVAALENLDPLKWSPWVPPGTPIPTPISAATSDYDPLGAYEGARYLSTGVFRPSPTCRMRELGFDFCAVCSEAMVLGFSELRILVDDVSPAEGTAIPGKGPSQVTAAVPALPDLTFSWAVDGAVVPGEVASTFALDPSVLGLADGPHQITVTVHDATPYVRTDPEGVMTATSTRSLVVDSTLPPIGGEGGSGGAGAGRPGPKPGGDDESAEEDDGCGCAVPGTRSGSAAAGILGLSVLALRRRRSRITSPGAGSRRGTTYRRR